MLVPGAPLFVATLANLSANDAARRRKPVVWSRLASRTDVRSLPTEAKLRNLVEAQSCVPTFDAVALST